MSADDPKPIPAAPGDRPPAGERAEQSIGRLDGRARGADAPRPSATADLYLRERAELENFKKRMQREKAEALRFAASTWSATCCR